MPKPEIVKTSQTFQLDKIIYNQNGFSIGIGTYFEKDGWVVSMRWNGNEDKAGFPYAGKNPLWFTLPVNLTFSFLSGLIQNELITKEDFNRILEYLQDYTGLKKSQKEIDDNDKLFNELFS